MSNVISFVPVSSPTVPGTASSKPNGIGQFRHLFNQFIASAVFWCTKSHATSNLGTGSVDEWKMDKLQEELATLKLFGASIAHDLSNVLTVIVGNLELARLSYPKSEFWPTFRTRRSCQYG
jgi:signal transduction histidine kinase